MESRLRRVKRYSCFCQEGSFLVVAVCRLGGGHGKLGAGAASYSGPSALYLGIIRYERAHWRMATLASLFQPWRDLVSCLV